MASLASRTNRDVFMCHIHTAKAKMILLYGCWAHIGRHQSTNEKYTIFAHFYDELPTITTKRKEKKRRKKTWTTISDSFQRNEQFAFFYFCSLAFCGSVVMLVVLSLRHRIELRIRWGPFYYVSSFFSCSMSVYRFVFSCSPFIHIHMSAQTHNELISFQIGFRCGIFSAQWALYEYAFLDSTQLALWRSIYIIECL